MIEITNDMEKVISSDNAVAYFTGEWCQPCKKLKPEYAKVGMQDNNNNYFVIDVDRIDSKYLEKYNIKSIPTVLKMDKGEVVKVIKSRTGDEIFKEVNEVSE